MEGEGERERDQANRIMEELRELLSSPSEPGAPGTVGTDHSFHASFKHLQLSVETNMTNIKQTADQALSDTNYREKLRSYHSFQTLPSPAATLSDTSSQRCTDTDMMEIEVWERSLSDGDGLECRRQPRPQARQRRESAQSKGKSQGDQRFVTTTSRGPSRRSYKCDVCGKIFPSPQSLGGHKNVHKSKGKNQRPSCAPPIVDHKGREAGSGSNSGESDSVPSLYKGVRCRVGEKWVTEIRPPKSKDKWWLGTFPSAEEAAQAYDVALAYFKSESELNFGYHPLYQKFPPLPSGEEFAQRLRDMVKDISEQIIAERRSEEQAANSSPLGHRPAASPANSSSSTAAPTTSHDPQ